MKLTADTFGNALGNSIVGHMQYREEQARDEKQTYAHSEVGEPLNIGSTSDPSSYDLSGLDLTPGADGSDDGMLLASNGSTAGLAGDFGGLMSMSAEEFGRLSEAERQQVIEQWQAGGSATNSDGAYSINLNHDAADLGLGFFAGAASTPGRTLEGLFDTAVGGTTLFGGAAAYEFGLDNDFTRTQYGTLGTGLDATLDFLGNHPVDRTLAAIGQGWDNFKLDLSIDPGQAGLTVGGL